MYHEDMLVLAMEYAQGGSLKSAIDKGRLGGIWLDKTRIARVVAQCLHYIHHQKVQHHDLKSAKVLLTERLWSGHNQGRVHFEVVVHWW